MIRNIYNLVGKTQNGFMSWTSTDSCIGLIAMPIHIIPAPRKTMLETWLKGLVFPLAINVRKSLSVLRHKISTMWENYWHFPWAQCFVILVHNILPSHYCVKTKCHWPTCLFTDSPTPCSWVLFEKLLVIHVSAFYEIRYPHSFYTGQKLRGGL